MNQTINRVLVNGCSFSRGPESWPYYLSTQLGFNLVNLAQSGAGNNYIHESTVEELAQRSYDLVIIMWSGLERFDVQVGDIEYFSSSIYNSKCQKSRNDWPEKIIYPINDQDYVRDNWVFGCGVVNNELELLNTKLFNGLYKHMDSEQFAYHSLQRMIALQSFLQAQQIPYVFTFYQDYLLKLKHHEFLYKLIDADNLLIKDNISNIANRLNDWDHTNHPKQSTHRVWAQLINEHLNERFRISTTNIRH